MKKNVLMILLIFAPITTEAVSGLRYQNPRDLAVESVVEPSIIPFFVGLGTAHIGDELEIYMTGAVISQVLNLYTGGLDLHKRYSFLRSVSSAASFLGGFFAGLHLQSK